MSARRRGFRRVYASIFVRKGLNWFVECAYLCSYFAYNKRSLLFDIRYPFQNYIALKCVYISFCDYILCNRTKTISYGTY